MTIARNAGVDSSTVVEKVLASKEQNYGYDALKGEYGDMIAKGIVDPTKVKLWIFSMFYNIADVFVFIKTY